ncbi:flagellar biosynthesis anti-sigma factor FlgM [Gemmata sp. JC673]|uniref:Flagellar biosynthesis anti-sigma factor FlgM n=1 Tax=Gemmata algarum TaxID=2975278 RepID=A0ABU5EXZ7_9BACT|nr:flagellar biosynthesis anti-sigma factor FlgM [Gemmata algarum]
MRETSPRGWHRWRVAVVKSAPAAPAFDRFARRSGSPVAEPAPIALAAEAKNVDGIRHELVARVRQQIADGTYDTEEKWLLAEEALLRRAEGRI